MFDKIFISKEYFLIQIHGLTKQFDKFSSSKNVKNIILKGRIFGIPGLINHFDEFGTLISWKFVCIFVNVEIGTIFCRKP